MICENLWIILPCASLRPLRQKHLHISTPLPLYTATNPTLDVLYGKSIYTFLPISPSTRLQIRHLASFAAKTSTRFCTFYTVKNPRLSSLAFTRNIAKSLHTPTPLARKVFFCITVVAWRFGVLEIWRGISWSFELKWESGLFTIPFVKLSQIGLTLV